jgi:hypothetical protein
MDWHLRKVRSASWVTNLTHPLTTFYLVNLGMEGVVYIEGEMIEPSTMQIFVPRLLTSRSAIPQ